LIRSNGNPLKPYKKMKTFITGLVLVGVCLAFSANATVVTYNGSYGPTTTTYYNKVIGVQGFDPALGSLNSVTVGFTGTGLFTQFFENTSPLSGNILVSTHTLAMSLLQPDAATSLFNLNQFEAHTYAVNPFDGTLDFGGTSGGTQTYGVNLVGSTILTSGAGLTQFTSASPVSLYLNAVATFSSSDTTGNSARGGMISAGANVSVTYDYTPVPEPSSFALMFGGLLLLPATRRALRRNRLTKP
jgi:hypothetical protein